jgi:hypothetical protein
MASQNRDERGIKMNLSILLSVLLIIGSSLASAGSLSSVKCQGGDGPNPLADISHQLSPRIDVFDTEGSVQELILWERKGLVAYRNHRGMIYYLPLSSSKSHRLGSSRFPLSQVKDQGDRYLSIKNRATVLDTEAALWLNWPHHREVRHLYWHRFLGRESLFSIHSSLVGPRQQRIEVLSFNDRGIKPHLCNLVASPGEMFHLGEGHVYPYVFLYKVKKGIDSTLVSYYNIQIEGELIGVPTCRLYKAGHYSTKIPGNVTEVYQFPELMQGNNNMFVVKTDNPQRQLLWDDGTYGCRYYQFGGRDPMVLNSKQAVIATWDEAEGLNLIYPRRLVDGQPMTLSLLKGQVVGPIKKEHLALSDDGKLLLVAAELKNAPEHSGRKIIKINLQNF